MNLGRLLVACTLAFSLGACGDGTDNRPDAGIICHCDAGLPADAIVDTCNKVAQTGCDFMQRCTLHWDSVDPVQGLSTCTDDGTKLRGEPCTIDPVSGFDDCISGTICYDGLGYPARCSAFCVTRGTIDTCDVGTCLAVEGFGDTQGICVP